MATAMPRPCSFHPGSLGTPRTRCVGGLWRFWDSRGGCEVAQTLISHPALPLTSWKSRGVISPPHGLDFLHQVGETHLDLRVIVEGARTAHVMACQWVPFSPLKGLSGQSPCGRPGTPCLEPPGNCSRQGLPWSAGSAIGPRLYKGARWAQGDPLHDLQAPFTTPKAVHPALAVSLLALAKEPRAHSPPQPALCHPHHFPVSEHCCTTGPLHLLYLLHLSACRANSCSSSEAQSKPL